MNKNKDHEILSKPWEYEIIEFKYSRLSNEETAPFIEIVLKQDSEIVTLRFSEPKNIKIEEGFPVSGGLYIEDVSEDQLTEINVKVGNYESGGGGVYFWAKDVHKL